MRSAMQAAYESYFKKLDSLYDAVWGTKPTVPYSGDCDPSLFVGAPDEDGEVPWMPKLQPVPCGWGPVEAKLGFPLRQELKDYYNTYFFLSLAGAFGSCELHFYRIDGSRPLEELVERQHADAQHVFPGSQRFLIGNAVVNGDDSYFLYYDNETGKLFCWESDTKNEVLLAYSIAKIIGSMEAIL